MILKDLICDVLENYPETRASDNKLYFRCCRRLGLDPLKELQNDGLSIITVHKWRQKIQNNMGLYLPEKEVIQQRRIRERRMREVMSSYC